MPTLKNLFGNFFPKGLVFNESVVSAPTTTTFGFSSPILIRVSPYTARISVISVIQSQPHVRFVLVLIFSYLLRVNLSICLRVLYRQDYMPFVSRAFFVHEIFFS